MDHQVLISLALLMSLAACTSNVNPSSSTALTAVEPNDTPAPTVSLAPSPSPTALAPSPSPTVLATTNQAVPEELILSVTSWSTTIRAEMKSLTATFKMSDGTTQDVTTHVTWVSSDPQIVSIGPLASPLTITALKVGTATLTASSADPALSASLNVTVGEASVIIQWGGWAVSGYGIYSPSGVLSSTLVNDSPTLDRRGMLALPGGFLSLGSDPNNGGAAISEYISNSGVVGTTPIILQKGTWNNGPQSLTVTHSGNYLLPEGGNGNVDVFGPDGTYIASFTTVNLSPSIALELKNGHIVVPSWDGRLAEFAPSGNSYAYVQDFATGFTNPFGADYCASNDTILVNDFTAKKVYSCTNTGSCTVLANHGLTSGRGLRINLNSGDCSFFLNYYDAGSSSYKIALFNADGSLANASWTTLSGSVNKVFAMDFLIPAAQ